MTTHGLDIAPLTLCSDSVEALSRILVDVVADGGSVWFLHPLPAATARDYWGDALAAADAGRRIVLGGRLAGELVATVTLDLATPPNQPHRAEIAKLMTRPDCRGQGAASALMREAERLAAQLRPLAADPRHRRNRRRRRLLRAPGLPAGRINSRLRPDPARQAHRHDPLLEAAGARLGGQAGKRHGCHPRSSLREAGGSVGGRGRVSGQVATMGGLAAPADTSHRG